MAKLDAYEVSLELIPVLRPLVEAIALHDRSLSEQIRRAGSSVPLNVAEGARRNGRDRTHAYRIAAGSAAEVLDRTLALLSAAHALAGVRASVAVAVSVTVTASVTVAVTGYGDRHRDGYGFAHGPGS